MAEVEKGPLQIVISGADELLGGIDTAQERIRDPFGRGVRQRIKKEISVEISESFKTTGRSTGRQWRGLSERYAAWKGVKYPGKGILVATGEMKAHLLSTQLNIMRPMSKTRIQWRHTGPIAAFHQEGSAKLPARPVIIVNKDFGRIIGQHVQDGITGVHLVSVRKLFTD